jgi:transcriptional regulator with XRE-family HTH domain
VGRAEENSQHMDLSNVGRQIRRLRQVHGVSTAHLAEVIDVSRGYLSRLENGHQIPSLVLLQALAEHFDTEIGFFFETTTEQAVAIERQAAQLSPAVPADDTFTYEPLCSDRGRKQAHPFIAVFKGNTTTHVEPHSAELFRYVLDGMLILKFPHAEYKLAAGDAVYYDALQQHDFICPTDEPARVLTLFIPGLPQGLSSAPIHVGHRGRDEENTP